MSRLGMVLQQAGFQSKRVNHGKLRGWLVRERDSEEINADWQSAEPARRDSQPDKIRH